MNQFEKDLTMDIFKFMALKWAIIYGIVKLVRRSVR